MSDSADVADLRHRLPTQRSRVRWTKSRALASGNGACQRTGR